VLVTGLVAIVARRRVMMTEKEVDEWLGKCANLKGAFPADSAVRIFAAIMKALRRQSDRIRNLESNKMVYRGTYKFGPYRRGDVCTWDGSLWWCRVAETSDKPDYNGKDWQLVVKRGRDGKDGKNKVVTLP
jgi:hypothetical protein